MVAKAEKILAPTDYSELGETGLRIAAQIAQLHGARLILLNVISKTEREELCESYLPRNSVDELFADLERGLKEHFWKLVPGSERNNIKLETGVREGTPYEEILAAAKEKDVDLIVMATHGRTGLSHLIMGSVAEKVVRNSLCPVLTVRPGKDSF